MMVVLAGITVMLLLISEIAALAPTPQAKRLRIITIWCALPALAVFGAVWLVHIRGVLDAAP
jgi:hypothetical protein